jgi:hypothetical protein
VLPAKKVRAPYQRARLYANNGKLVITANAGKMFGAANTQLNALGVNVAPGPGGIDVTTTIDLQAFPQTNLYGQQGIWFGLDDDNYIKLVLVDLDPKVDGADLGIQLFIEINGAKSSDNARQMFTTLPPAARMSGLSLRLSVDLYARSVSGGFGSGANTDYFTFQRYFLTPFLLTPRAGVFKTGLFASTSNNLRGNAPNEGAYIFSSFAVTPRR